MFSQILRILIVTGLSLFFITTNTAAAEIILGIFPKGDKPNGFLFLALTLLALFLALAIHELGHLVAGIIQGFRFELFIVGLLGIKRAGDGIRLFLNKNIGYMGGVVATVPVNQSPKNRRKFAIVLASGPIASFLFFIVAFLLFFNSSTGAARGFWFVAGATSLAVFLATTLPTKTGIFFTDRARYQRLMNKGKVGEMEEALLTIIAHNIKDNSCKTIPLDKARFLQSDNDKTMRFWGYYYEYCYLNDNSRQHESEVAKENLYLLKDAIPSHLWKALKIDKATNT